MTDRIPSRPDGEPIPCRGCQYFTGPGCGCDNAGHDRPQNPGPRPGLDQISSDDLDTLYARAENAEAEIERMKLLVAAASGEGHAVRMAAQYAERAIENGKRAERAEAVAAAERKRTEHAAITAGQYSVEAGKQRRRAERAEAAIERVRRIHVRNTHTGDCEYCSARDYPDYAVPHPCPTIRALDEHQEQP